MISKAPKPEVLCSELVTLEWAGANGQRHHAGANMDGLSAGWAWLQIDHAVPTGTGVRIAHRRGELRGTTRCCLRENSSEYSVAVEFEEGSRWVRRRFRPRHLLVPETLLIHQMLRERMPKVANAGC
ncbi:MAG: hypothetical protein NVSMB62_29580 [Acidobacteriaceae bacterium]